MIYSNRSGTTASSFKIGARGIELASSNVINDSTNVLNGFKRLTATYNGTTKGLVYDVEIPEQFVVDCRPSDEDPNIYYLVLLNRYTGSRETVVINAGLGNTGVGFEGSNAVENNLATYADDTGKKIKDSGYSIYNGELGPGSTAQTTEVPTVSSVYTYVGQLTDYLANRINGERLENN